MLRGPGAAQRLLDPIGFLFLDLHVAQRQQPIGIPLPGQDGFDDLEPAGADQAADHVMQFHIHPLQRLLLVLHAGGGTGQMIGPQPQVVLQTPDLRRRHKARLQQPVGVERGTPLAILHVRLASRQIAVCLPLTMLTLKPAASSTP